MPFVSGTRHWLHRNRGVNWSDVALIQWLWRKDFIYGSCMCLCSGCLNSIYLWLPHLLVWDRDVMSAETVLRNVYSYLEVLEAAYSDAVSRWDVTALQHAFKWAAYCTQVDTLLSRYLSHLCHGMTGVISSEYTLGIIQWYNPKLCKKWI